ncbi:MAG: methyltransferase domain-containing protein [Desulfovibrionaceae bacterium]|nr:methyltransferase domain-containing protein [Desulfovibrionaceae bacterium]
MVINLDEEPCAATPKARIRTHGEAQQVCGGRSVMGVPTASFVMELFAPNTFSCPICSGMDRERLVGAYLLRRLGRGFHKSNFRLLEIAPRPSIGNFIKKHFVVRHQTADMFMKGVDYQINLSCMPEIESSSCDAWICLHVLEHVPNDQKAISELFRILKPSGFGIILVPISLTLVMTDEDPDTSITERWSRFGQDDHIRLYAKQDFMNRLAKPGFLVRAFGKEYFGEILLKTLGLPLTSVLYVIEKP